MITKAVPASRALIALRWAPHGSTTLLRRSSSSVELYRTSFGETLSTGFAKSNAHATP